MITTKSIKLIHVEQFGASSYSIIPRIIYKWEIIIMKIEVIIMKIKNRSYIYN